MWDFTYTDTMAPSHIQKISQPAGTLASVAEISNRSKYTNLLKFKDLSSFAIESFCYLARFTIGILKLFHCSLLLFVFC